MPQDAAAFMPSSQQKTAFNWALTGKGNLNLIAFAGTGKTTTLCHMMEYCQGSIYYGAFNKAIITDVEEKVASIPGLDKSRVDIRTIHSLGMRAWRRANSGYKLTVDKYKVRKLIDEYAETQPEFGVQQNFIRKAVDYAKQAGFGTLCRVKDPDNWVELIDHFSIEQEIKGGESDMDKLIAMCQMIFDASLKSCKHELDFADMLLAPLYYDVKFPKFDWVYIDEAQDISAVRLAIICKTLKPTTRVVAVGDPYQAIYGFAGANSESLDTIKERLDCAELPLSVTYRCPKVVVEVAQRWVPGITAHPSSPHGNKLTVWMKPKRNLEPGGEIIPQTGFWDVGPYTNNDVILCRNSRPLVQLAYEFLRKGIPAYVEGREIGEGLIALATRWKSPDLSDLTIRLEEYRQRETKKFNGMKMESRAADVEDTVETMNVLIESTVQQGGRWVSDLVSLINKLFGDTPEGEKPKCLTLSTIHKSKGREWKRVFILGMDKYMPSKWARKDWELKQEDNLAYVAVTRAKETLVDVVVPD